MHTRLLLPLLLALIAGACQGSGTGPLPFLGILDEGEGWSVRFEGNESMTAGELRGAIAARLRGFEREGISKPGVDDAAYEIEIFYREQGFDHAFVDYEWKEEGDGGVRAVFLVDEGARIQLERLELRGLESFGEEELRAFFPPGAGRSSEDPAPIFVRARLGEGVEAMRTFYRQSGFLEAKLADPVVTFDETGTRATATVSIVEGARFTLAATDVSFHGALGRGEDFEGELRRHARRFLQEGEAAAPPFTPRLGHALRAYLLAFYGGSGFPDCTIEIETELDSVTGRVSLALEIDAGPRVRIAHIDIRGNEKTRTSFIRSRIEIEDGDRYDAAAIRGSFAKLFATGLFEEIKMGLEAGEDRDRVLIVEVVELPTIEFFVEPGYGSYEGPRLRVGAEERNAWGTGRSLLAESTVGPLAQSAKVGFVDRTLFRTDLQLSGSVHFDHRVEPSYTLDEVGTGLELLHAWPEEHLTATLGYHYRRTDLENVDLVDPDALEALEDVDISSISTSLTRDTRNHPLVPRRGNRARVGLEWASSAFGSEVDFLAARLDAVQFWPLPWEGGVLGFSARTGVIGPIGDSEVIPLSLRHFNGGESTVRSFREDELGPRDPSGEPLGGETYTVLTAELRQDLFSKFSGAIFLDVGNVASDVEDYFEFDGMRKGLGIGIRYMLPIGPLRIDAALNPDALDHEDDYAIHFSVGMSF
jgi:outer membrane protein insertion porin family